MAENFSFYLVIYYPWYKIVLTFQNDLLKFLPHFIYGIIWDVKNLIPIYIKESSKFYIITLI